MKSEYDMSREYVKALPLLDDEIRALRKKWQRLDDDASTARRWWLYVKDKETEAKYWATEKELSAGRWSGAGACQV